MPTNEDAFVTGARDEWLRRTCDPGRLARSECDLALRVSILVRSTNSVTHQFPRNASDPKTHPSGPSGNFLP